MLNSVLAGAGGCEVAVSPAEDVIRFGLFELDLKAGQLSRNGTKLRLPQQPLQLLATLLERPGEIITRDELRQRLWSSDVFVDFDHGLNKSIQKLRDALGDSATSPRYIETIPRVGYRFIAPVRNGTRPLAPEVAIKIDRSVHPPAARAVAGKYGKRWWILIAGGFTGCAVLAVYLFSLPHHAVIQYTQLTDFTDSAVAPALSSDGHMLAFIRGDSNFMSADQIYAKVLPDGEARRLTDDPRLKYGVAFSPDGSQIAYTVMETQPVFGTYTVSVLGGDSHLLMHNAAGLSWLDPGHFLFSRTRSGVHLGVVTQPVAGDHDRELYFPPHERGMAHYSYASPDRTSALVVEMNGQGNWATCRLISLEGRFTARPIGPEGGCTSAGWAPDGSWMYFIATIEGQSHLWRQRFPDGRPEQITFGPMEEEGLAVEPDGRSVISSIGVRASAIWIHDDRGERSLSSEGEIVADLSPPSFTAEDTALYYLLRRPPAGAGAELWRMAVDSGKSEAVFPGVSMVAYDVSPDDKQVVYATAGSGGKSELWLAPIDRSTAPKQIGQSGETTPYFGPRGKIVFQIAEGNFNYLEQMNEDGSGRSKVVPYPITDLRGISPGRKWLTGIVPYSDGKKVVPMEMAIPLDGGPPLRICASYCVPAWSSSGRFLFLAVEAPTETSPGRSLAIPLGPGESLAAVPPGGITAGAEPEEVPGSQSVNRALLVPGKDPSHFAYVNTTSHRNLYRISLP
jgi:DNA-binding winged helix-turn-helix (wHTH) protein/Tol biopolymer transport system component